jgi:hypothetical protein
MIHFARSNSVHGVVAWLVLGTVVGCGPHHHDGGGTAGAGGSIGAAGSDEGGEGGSVSAGTGGGAGTSGTGGAAAGTGGGGGAGTSGAGGEGGGGGGRLGYDAVIGCAAPRYADRASLTVVPAQPEIYARRLSGDGKVVGGQAGSFGPTFRWRPPSGIEQVEGLRYDVNNVSCDGSVLLTAESSSGVWRHRVGEEAEQVIPGGDYFLPKPLSLTPDGEVVVGHLAGYADLGPHPVRWTRASGLEPIPTLDNTLVQSVTPDGNTVLGIDVLRIFRFTWGETKQFVQGWVPSDGFSIRNLTVSGNGETYVFNASRHSLLIDSIRQEVDCPSVSCEPIALSGTGKVLMLVGPTGPAVDAPWATFVWTARHGFRSLNDLMSEHGAPPPGTLFANDMSDDGQVFTGYMTNPVGAPFEQFYAVLPPEAYD